MQAQLYFLNIYISEFNNPSFHIKPYFNLDRYLELSTCVIRQIKYVLRI